MKKLAIPLLLTIFSFSGCLFTENSTPISEGDKQITAEYLEDSIYAGNLHLYNEGLTRVPDFGTLLSGTGKTKVKFIDLSGNDIEVFDGKMFMGLENLKEINAPFNKIKKLINLKHIKQVEILNLNKNELTDISGIEKVVSLRSLNLSFNQLDNIDPVGMLEQLIVLHLAHNNITNVDALAKNKKLLELHVEFNQISNIDSLLGAMTIKVLSAGKNNLPEDLVKTLNEMSIQNTKK